MAEISVYKTKVDWWLAVIIIGIFVYGLASMVWGIYLFAVTGAADIWLFFTGVFIVLLILGLVWPMEYHLLDDELLVRNGVFRSRYKYEIITGVAPTHNPLSSPALSLDRLKIRYKGMFGFLMISPADKEGFMKDIASRAPHLEYADGVVKLKS